MRVEWTPEALDDLERALSYIAERRPSAAAGVAAKIDSTIESIRQFSLAGRVDAKTGSRERVVGGYPYLIIYTLDERAELVEIIAVFHTSRDPDSKRSP